MQITTSSVKGFNAPLSTQNPISARDTVTGSTATRTVYTVTTGKTLYLTGMLGAYDDLSAATHQINLRNNAGTIIATVSFGSSSATNEKTIYIPLPFIKFTSAQIVQWNPSTTDNNAFFTIFGWEE